MRKELKEDFALMHKFAEHLTYVQQATDGNAEGLLKETGMLMKSGKQFCRNLKMADAQYAEI